MLIGVLPHLQVGATVAGLVFSIYVGYRIWRQHSPDVGQAIRGLVPVVAFLTAVSVGFLWLYLG